MCSSISQVSDAKDVSRLPPVAQVLANVRPGLLRSAGHAVTHRRDTDEEISMACSDSGSRQ